LFGSLVFICKTLGSEIIAKLVLHLPELGPNAFVADNPLAKEATLMRVKEAY
jgi:hypothetical protein